LDGVEGFGAFVVDAAVLDNEAVNIHDFTADDTMQIEYIPQTY